MNYKSVFLQLYGSSYLHAGGAAVYFDGLLWSITSYLCAAMTGYLITTLYYRMSKAVKITFSIGVPAMFFIVLPYIDGTLANGVIFQAIGSFFAFVNGFSNGFNPYYAVVSGALCFLLLSGLSYLLVRRAVIKD